MLSLVTISPVITAFHSCCLLHHVFDRVNIWPAWIGFETAIFWQCSPGTVETQRLWYYESNYLDLKKSAINKKLILRGIYIYMCVCVCVCMYIYIHTHTHTYIYIYTCVCACVCVCWGLYISTYVCMYIFIYRLRIYNPIEFEKVPQKLKFYLSQTGTFLFLIVLFHFSSVNVIVSFTLLHSKIIEIISHIFADYQCILQKAS